MKYQINIVIEKCKFGFYAYAPQLPGCHTQGKTRKEASANIKEAAELYLECLPKSKRKKLLASAHAAVIEVSIA